MVKLCTFVSPAEELAQKDDLQLLFSAITSWCPPHNLPWRRSAGEVLTTISRHGLSVNVVKYIHGETSDGAAGGWKLETVKRVCEFVPLCSQPRRERMSGHVRPEHAAVGRPVAAGDRGDVRRPLLLPQGLQRRVADLAGRLQNVPGLRLPLRSHAQVPSPALNRSARRFGRCFTPAPVCVQTGTDQGGRVQRRAEGPGQPGDLSDHVRGDGAETCRTHHWRPLPAAWLCAAPTFGQRSVHIESFQLFCCRHPFFFPPLSRPTFMLFPPF